MAVDREKLWKYVGRGLLILWAVLFVWGALGELLGFDFPDIKRIFLR